MSDFSTTISQWGVFYATTAGVSATLLGLLFVGITFRIDVIQGEGDSHTRAQVLQSYWGFAYPLLTAFLFLMPNQSPSGLGIPLFFIGLAGVLSTVRAFVREIRTAKPTLLTMTSYRRDAARILGYISLLVLAILAYEGQTYWLPFMGGAVLWLLGTATSRAFSLVMNASATIHMKDNEHSGG